MSRSSQTNQVRKFTDRNQVLGFGKYKKATIGDLIHDDPGYLVWCCENLDWFELSQDLMDAAEGRESQTEVPYGVAMMGGEFDF